MANPGAAQADAHFHLAVLYVTGATGKADYSRALQHFNSASHAGHLMAVYNLALMHLTGLGIPVSCPTALALLKSVAERGLWSQVLQRAHAAFLQVLAALLRVFFIPWLCFSAESGNHVADFQEPERARPATSHGLRVPHTRSPRAVAGSSRRREGRATPVSGADGETTGGNGG